LEQPESQGVVVNGRFYLFTRHFLDNRANGVHPEATDELIIEALSEPDYILPPEGNRTVYWKRIAEPDKYIWWLVVVVAEETSGLQVLTVYRDTTTRGERLWGK
jgi:hypothetical protein